MKIRWIIPALLLILFFSLAATAGQAPFVGEKLQYEFGWSGFTAAKADVEISAMQFRGQQVYKVGIELNSLSRLDWIWKVRDKVTTWSRQDTLVPERYVYKQREGKFHLDTIVDRDPQDGILRSTRTRYKDGKQKQYNPKWAHSKGTVDPIGALLFLRTRDLKVGEEYRTKVFDGKRTHEAAFKVTGIENLKTKFGDKECFVVIPRIIKSSKGKADNIQAEKVEKTKVWVTTSPEHMIMRVEAKAWVGYVFAELTKM